MPYFVDLESCPPRTMALLPKPELLAARILHDQWTDSPTDNARWHELMSAVRARLVSSLTTEAMAQMVLSRMGLA
jgi:hypothetical protein